MGIQDNNSYENQSRRQQIKTIHSQMQQLAVQGAGLNPWEAKVLTDMIDDVYFTNHQLTDIKNGQVKFSCVSAKEGAGKPLKECAMISAVLTLFDPQDDLDLPCVENKQRQIHKRLRRVMRLCDEAKDQGGLLSQEDLSELLMCDVKTIQRDTKILKESGIVLPTRGQQKDIGPGLTHRELIVRLWCEGTEPVELCTRTKHSIKSVENYLEKFKIIVFLRQVKSFTNHEIAVVAGLSSRAVKVFLELYEKYRNKSFFKHRRDEILLRGAEYYREVGEKKDLLLSNTSEKVWRTR